MTSLPLIALLVLTATPAPKASGKTASKSASKRAGKPVIPRLFWYMSVLGSLMTLSYFLFSAKQDSVGVLQNLFPAFTALYSLYLDIRHRGWHRDKASH